MAKKESEKKALKAIDKAVRKAIKSGVSGGLVDQTVATSIHAVTVKAAWKAVAPTKEKVKAERPVSPKKAAKATKRTEQDVDGGSDSNRIIRTRQAGNVINQCLGFRALLL
jgi:hypothetical protein